VIGPFDNKGDGTVDTAQPVETAAFDPAASFTGKDKKEIKWAKAERPAGLAPGLEHVLKLHALYGRPNNASAYALVWVRAAKACKAVLSLGSDDGVVAWLNGRRIHAVLSNRGYNMGADRVPVELNAGDNKLLMRVTQTSGDWCLGAEFLGEDGKPMIGLSYSLDPAQP
jgi:hypothetical protein